MGEGGLANEFGGLMNADGSLASYRMMQDEE